MKSGGDVRRKRTGDVPVGNIGTLESTLPLRHRKSVAPADRASILVFSHDAHLANVIKSAARDQYDARVCDEWRDLLKLVEAGRSRVVLLDFDALGMSVEKALKLLNDRADWLVIVIAAKQAQAQDFMTLWSERRIHRLLIKPASLGITRLLLESAVGRFVELRELYNQPQDEFLAEPMDGGPNFERQRRVRLPAVAVTTLVILGVGLLLGARFYDSVSRYLGLTAPLSAQGFDNAPPFVFAPPAAAERDAADVPEPALVVEAAPAEIPAVGAELAPVAAEPEAVPADPYAARLAAASEALSQGRLVEPLGASALDQYLGILAEAPEHALAREQLGALVEELFSRAEAALLDGDLDMAAKTLGDIRRAGPAGSRLRFLEQQLVREQSSASAAAAAETPAPASVADDRVLQASTDAAAAASASSSEPVAAVASSSESRAPSAPPELDGLLAEAEGRLSRGFLLQPAGDSARDFLERAAAVAPSSLAVLELRLRLAESLTASARLLLDAGVLEGAEELALAAFDLGASSEAIDAFQADLEQARAVRDREQIAAAHAAAVERIESGSLVRPAAESARLAIEVLQERDPAYAGLPELVAAFGAAAEAQIEAAVATQSWQDAEDLLAALAALRYDAAATGSLREGVDFARMQAQYLATPAPVSELELLRSVTPVYPRAAVDRDATGWVDVEFIVDADGATRNVAVVNSEPVGAFEDSAVAAVRQYEFAPFVRNGRVFERRVQLRIRYALN